MEVNFLAVLLAAIASMVLGSLWYGPVFGKQWMMMAGISEEKMKAGGKNAMIAAMVTGFITSLVTAYVFATFLRYVGEMTVQSGLTLGFWVWLGFFATTQLGVVIWEMKSVKLYVLNTAYSLANLLIMGAIVGGVA